MAVKVMSCVEGQQLRYCGVGAGFEEVIIDGNLDELKVGISFRMTYNFDVKSCRYLVRRLLCQGG